MGRCAIFISSFEHFYLNIHSWGSSPAKHRRLFQKKRSIVSFNNCTYSLRSSKTCLMLDIAAKLIREVIQEREEKRKEPTAVTNIYTLHFQI